MGIVPNAPTSLPLENNLDLDFDSGIGVRRKNNQMLQLKDLIVQFYALMAIMCILTCLGETFPRLEILGKIHRKFRPVEKFPRGELFIGFLGFIFPLRGRQKKHINKNAASLSMWQLNLSQCRWFAFEWEPQTGREPSPSPTSPPAPSSPRHQLANKPTVRRTMC